VAAAEQRQAAADQLRAEQAERNSALDKLREDPFTAMFAARAALQNNDRFELKHNGSAAAGRSPPRGGLDASAHNQQLLTDELAEEATGAAGPGAGDGGDDGACVRGRRWLCGCDQCLRLTSATVCAPHPPSPSHLQALTRFWPA
jgi:hypothetical protein